MIVVLRVRDVGTENWLEDSVTKGNCGDVGSIFTVHVLSYIRSVLMRLIHLNAVVKGKTQSNFVVVRLL
jgi:hypothetical protein